MKHTCGDVFYLGKYDSHVAEHACVSVATRISTVYEGLEVYVCDIDHWKERGGEFFEPWRVDEGDECIYPIPKDDDE